MWGKVQGEFSFPLNHLKLLPFLNACTAHRACKIPSNLRMSCCSRSFALCSCRRLITLTCSDPFGSVVHIFHESLTGAGVQPWKLRKQSLNKGSPQKKNVTTSSRLKVLDQWKWFHDLSLHNSNALFALPTCDASKVLTPCINFILYLCSF